MVSEVSLHIPRILKSIHKQAMSISEKQFFGPLTLQQAAHGSSPNLNIVDECQDCLCVLCDLNFTFPSEEQDFLAHLFKEHRLVIADFKKIADLKDYICFWRLKFRDHPLEYYCTTMHGDVKPDGTKSENEPYYLLSDILPEDKEIRLNLQQTRLEKIMKLHQFEREDKNFECECLFCRFVSKDTRANYLNHLYEKHNFHIAKPENLIFIDQLVGLLTKKLEKLQCIYCEKYFKDRTILKEHMRKKGHKRINPDNTEYDKFFLVNYGDKKPEYKLRHQRSNLRRQNVERKLNNFARDENNDSDSDSNWSDWTEENNISITCLLCEHVESEFLAILNHMERMHDFSFAKQTKTLTFYHKIKIVNYIRRTVHLKQCLTCETKFDDTKNLEKHMRESKHLVLSKEKWDQPEYYFPTYEDDLFLCFIQDDDEHWWSTDDQDEKRNSMSDSISKEMALAVLAD